MPISQAVLTACLNALAGLCAVIGGLLVLLTATQAWRGAAEAQPLATLTGAALALMAAFSCRFVARRLRQMG